MTGSQPTEPGWRSAKCGEATQLANGVAETGVKAWHP